MQVACDTISMMRPIKSTKSSRASTVVFLLAVVVGAIGTAVTITRAHDTSPSLTTTEVPARTETHVLAETVLSENPAAALERSYIQTDPIDDQALNHKIARMIAVAFQLRPAGLAIERTGSYSQSYSQEDNDRVLAIARDNNANTRSDLSRSIADTTSSLTQGGSFSDPTLTNADISTLTVSGSTTFDDPLTLAQTSAPATTTDKLYNLAGDLYWAGSVIGGAATGQWTSDGTNVWRAGGNVGIGTTSPAAKLHVDGTSLLTGRMVLGTRTPSTDDSAILIARAATNPLTLGGSHALRDESTYIASGSGGYASFDSIPTLSGSLAYSHLHSFQARPNYSGSTSVGQIAGLTMQLTQSGTGTATNVYGFRMMDALGTGPITYQVGIWCDGLTRGNANYCIYSGSGSLPSYLGGRLQLGTAPQISASGFTTYGAILSHDTTGNLLTNPNFRIANGVVVMSASTAKVLASVSNLEMESTSGSVLVRPGGTTAATFLSSGNVGIGTTAPGSRLSVSGGGSIGSGYAATAAPTNGLIVEGNVGIGTTAPFANLQANGVIKSGVASVNGQGAVVVGDGARIENFTGMFRGDTLTSGTGHLSLGGYSGIIFNASTHELGSQTERMRITDTGNVGIGTTTPQTRLHVAGVIAPSLDNSYTLGNSTYRFSEVYAANGVINTSDIRLKHDPQTLTYGLNTILALEPISYTWVDQPTQGTRFGLSAQHVRDLIPEIVAEGTDENKTLGIRYTELIPILINAVQELAGTVTTLAEGTFDTIFATTIVVENDIEARRGIFEEELRSDGRFCIGSTCITEADLQAVLVGQASTPSPTPIAPTPELTPEESASALDEEATEPDDTVWPDEAEPDEDDEPAEPPSPADEPAEEEPTPDPEAEPSEA